ncbi:MAG: bifunctional precorrin-2 dehydrogenase/sirohydrochlorin ferrochelatase [Armatimonadetes bacterium]|nr:bifunctional precorrin-2 dehydrogenase/sirohydrochlorin ferrochelatase [Armatimonadota bacterium]
MSLYPILIELQGRPCLVVGGGVVAERKVKTLMEYGAQVRVMAPDATPLLLKWADAGTLRWERRAYAPGGLGDALLVMAATDSRAVNAEVAREAKAMGRLVNVADSPEESAFIVPSSIRREGLVISIATSGQSPTMARYLREELEKRFGPEYGPLTRLLGELRDRLKGRDERGRVEAIRRMVDEGILDLIREGRLEEARKKAIACISS